MTLEETIQLLAKHRVLKWKGYVDGPRAGEGQLQAELELHPLAFVAQVEGPEMPKPGAFADTTGAGMCRCGHPLTSHGEHGLCLLGCDGASCELMDGNGKTTLSP